MLMMPLKMEITDGMMDDGDDDVDEHPEADVSTETNATVPDKKARDNFPDIMLSHIQTVERPMPDPNLGLHYNGWLRRLGARAFHRCFPLIGELKNAPPRGLQGVEYINARKKLLSAAADDLVVYLSMHFVSDPHASTVIGLVGAGGWWQWAEIRREDAVEYSDLAHSEEVVKGRQKISNRFDNRPVVWLGTQQSDQQWILLRAKVINILNFHHFQYPAAPTFD
ncbi:hypothetical protein K474DRAFT_661294 [Panus rudis PR-1116 ss-1]|nr:hypothetical protein K474DRAFT_661294 [Panus rudis PR-1116 ss-1]